MSDTEFLDDTEQDVSESHSKLLEAVSQLDKGQRVKRAERSEPSSEISEFHLVKSGVSDRDGVNVHDLAKILGKKGHHFDIRKNLKAAGRKVNVLKKPLEKPAADRIKRIVGFENAKEDLKKWNAIILKNRTAGTLHFPLKQLSMETEPEFVKRFRIQSDLEKELQALEPQKENIEKKDDEFALTLKEIITKRKEAARIRAQQSYKEAKARRQNKIKSKKFHRVQRKERIKLQLQEFEALQKTDPEAALKKLELLDKSRAEERMSLRHKSTGKWAKSKQIKAKYDKETRQELAQQLSISKELTHKLQKESDSEEEDQNAGTLGQPEVHDTDNPWVESTKTESEINEFIDSYRKYWDGRNEQPKETKLDANDEKKPEIKQTSVGNLKSLPTVQDQDNIADNKVLENQRGNKNVEEATRDHTSVIKNSSNKTAKRMIPADCQKLNVKRKVQKKTANSTASTSSWNVESIENNNKRNMFDSSTFDNLSKEKINKMFDRVEEKIEKQIKSKIRHVQEEYNKIAKKFDTKNKNNFKEEIFDKLELRSERERPILDSVLNETITENNTELSRESEHTKSMKRDNTTIVNKSNMSVSEIDPNKYITVKPKLLHTELPSVITAGDDVLDDCDNDENYNVISEAFADDDVVEEFQKEKEETAKTSEPKNIDLTLPGWGSWGGKNIQISRRKNRRFILKFPKDAPRKDENKGNVIIFEDDNAKIKEHQVNELPYPFTSVKDYEASIRMPMGRNFVPENAHKKLIEPAVETHMGKIIEPMTEDVLIKDEAKKYKNFIPKKRTKFVTKRKMKIK